MHNAQRLTKPRPVRPRLAFVTAAHVELSSRVSNATPTIVIATLAALLVRLAVIPFAFLDRLDPWRGHWRFAWEMGMVARSIATGHGIASPFPPDTGPTAWQAPVYPALMAAVFKVFGLFTPASAIVLLGMNALFSALTCVPVYFIARRTLGHRAARWAVWLWALFPYAIYLSAARIWENALTTLLLTTLIWVTIELKARSTTLLWAGYGVLWGITALTNPSTCALLPPFGLWIAWRRHRRRKPWFAPAVVGALLFAAVLMPWEVRNLRTFDRFIPLRDNFWMEVRVGNTGDLSDIYPDWAHPGRNPRELAEYQRLGETRYLAHMRDLSLDFIRRYPGYFAWLTGKRVLYTWTGFWSTNPVYTKDEPFQLPNTFFCTAMTVLAFLGLRRIWLARNESTPVYLIAVAVYPLVYYVTHPGIDYRHPIDPVIVILVAAALAGFRANRKAAQS